MSSAPASTLPEGEYEIEQTSAGDWRIVGPKGHPSIFRERFKSKSLAATEVLRMLAGGKLPAPNRGLATPEDTVATFFQAMARRGVKLQLLFDLPEPKSPHGSVYKIIVGNNVDANPSADVTIKLRVSPEMDAELDNLAEDQHVTKGDLFLRGVRLLKIAAEAKREGKRLAIIDDSDDSEQEITGF